ncbi:MAG: class I tRNA ligase family protein, partial [Gaiellaceae bacterium]
AERGLLEQREPFPHAVALCERCETRIEPLISLQWWCSMEALKQPALAALRERRVRFHPESQHRFAIDSLESAPDWCISRQLWWGHRIPVWKCPSGHVTVEESTPARCSTCGTQTLSQSEDVLDTWFSSALWPFATLGWPDETEDLRCFYPGDLQTTAREIIRLWENRMIFSGLELLGEVPFRDVVIHSTVLATDGRRMSKSLGTGIDPLDVIARHGADAVRYGLLKMSSTQDVRFSYGAVEEGRKLANKLWNVARLILANVGDALPAERPQELVERWILARLESARAEVEAGFEALDYASVVTRLYRVTFDEFCDWYAEAIKPRLYEGDADARATALAALERLLKLLHPVMPHVSEEIWSSLPARGSRLIVAAWPQADGRFAADAEALERVQDAARIFRRSGIEARLETPEEQAIFNLVARGPRRAGGGVPITEGLARELVRASDEQSQEVDVRVNPERLGEPPQAPDANRLAKEMERLQGEVARAERMLANAKFVERAPAEVVEAEREKLARYRRELAALARSESG